MGAPQDFTAIIEKVKGSVYQVAIELPSGTLAAGATVGAGSGMHDATTPIPAKQGLAIQGGPG